MLEPHNSAQMVKSFDLSLRRISTVMERTENESSLVVLTCPRPLLEPNSSQKIKDSLESYMFHFCLPWLRCSCSILSVIPISILTALSLATNFMHLFILLPEHKVPHLKPWMACMTVAVKMVIDRISTRTEFFIVLFSLDYWFLMCTFEFEKICVWCENYRAPIYFVFAAVQRSCFAPERRVACC